MRLFRAQMGLAVVVVLVASACGGQGERAPTPVGNATPIPTVAGARTPGQVRTLPEDLLDQEACYQLGAADAAQDQAAGATEERASQYADVDTGFLISGYGPQGEGLKGKPTNVAWVESAVVKVEVIVMGGPDQLPCGKAYTTGYMGFPFQPF
jgi:hypothetical protein